MRILHIAPFNTAGVPLTFVRAEKRLGFESRLVTLGRSSQDREEDVCLDFPFLDFWATRWIKCVVTPKQRRGVSRVAQVLEQIPLYWTAGGLSENLLIRFRELLWRSKIKKAIHHYDLLNYDVYQLDGGLGFYRDGRFVRELKNRGKKIICCYTGSDLRIRGVIPEIDCMSELNVTVEFDHLQYHPNIHHVPFPLDISQFNVRDEVQGDRIRIGHAPTHRAAKGSEVIIPVVKNLEKRYSVELVLIEGLSYNKAIEMKSTCHIFIDQIGDLGYGVNSIEALAMGIPTCSCLAPGFEELYSDHPFIVIDEQNLESKIVELIKNRRLRLKKGREGRKWVEKYHDFIKVVRKIHGLAGLS